MGFFSSLFGLGSDSKKSKILKDIDVMDAINAHVRWKLRLEKYLNGTSDEQLDPKVICLDDQCSLGKWIHGPAQEQFREDEGYQTLRDDHARFHIIASEIVTKIQSNDKSTAEVILKGDYTIASRKVVHDLTELSKLLSANG